MLHSHDFEFTLFSESDMLQWQEISTNSILPFGNNKEGTKTNLIQQRKKIRGFTMAEFISKKAFSATLSPFLKYFVFQKHNVLHTFIIGTLNK